MNAGEHNPVPTRSNSRDPEPVSEPRRMDGEGLGGVGVARESCPAEAWHSLLDLLPVAVWIAHDPRCEIITGNAFGSKLLQVAASASVSPAAPVQDRGWRRLWRDGRELRPEEMPLQTAINRNESIREMNFELELLDGRRISLLANVAPLHHPDGTVRGAVSVCLDMTDRKGADAARQELSQELAEAHRKLQQHAEELEEKIQQRTEELVQSNARLQAEALERKSVEESRAKLLGQLLNVQEAERRRVARELHDELGQHLTALSLRIKALNDAVAGTAPLETLVEPLQELTSRMGLEIHRLALELRPTALDDIGLMAALKNYVHGWARRFQIKAEFQSSSYESAGVSVEMKTAIYRTVQEALTNILKHARATRVSVILERRDGQIHAIIEDDGCGFDLDAFSAGSAGSSQLGLRGMKERLAILKGSLNIESSPGAGTTVFARIPLGLPTGARGEPSDRRGDEFSK